MVQEQHNIIEQWKEFQPLLYEISKYYVIAKYTYYFTIVHMWSQGRIPSLVLLCHEVYRRNKIGHFLLSEAGSKRLKLTSQVLIYLEGRMEEKRGTKGRDLSEGLLEGAVEVLARGNTQLLAKL